MLALVVWAAPALGLWLTAAISLFGEPSFEEGSGGGFSRLSGAAQAVRIEAEPVGQPVLVGHRVDPQGAEHHGPVVQPQFRVFPQDGFQIPQR